MIKLDRHKRDLQAHSLTKFSGLIDTDKVRQAREQILALAEAHGLLSDGVWHLDSPRLGDGGTPGLPLSPFWMRSSRKGAANW